MTAIKSILYLLVAQNFGFYIPLVFCWSSPVFHFEYLAYLAFVLWPIGILGVLWCFWYFTFKGGGTPISTDPPRELVVSGLYRFVRNPIYVSVILILLGHFLWFGYLSLLVYTGIAFLGTHLFVTLYEEPNLRKLFGVA